MSQKVMERFKQFVAPTYGRFPITLDRGEGAYVWDTDGKRYLDLGGGIAVNCLGHANAELAQALAEQSAKLMHCTNLRKTWPSASARAGCFSAIAARRRRR